MPKFLVVAPAWVGDSVMAQPLYRRLKDTLSGLQLEVMAPAFTLPLLRRMPEVDAVIENPFGHGALRLAERWRLGRELKRQGYDQAIVLPNSLKSALIPWFAGIPRRVGFVGEFRYGLLSDARKLDPRALPKMVERFAILSQARGEMLAQPLPEPRLQVNPVSRSKALKSLGLALDKPMVAFCPGAEYGPAKRWPPQHFAELARRLGQHGYQVWLFGSVKDKAAGEAIMAGSAGNVRNLCGVTSLEQAVDLLSLATLVVSNDSGLMHVAAALQRPLVALYGSSSPGFTPPLTEQAEILSLDLSCSPCFKRECPLQHFDCMQNLLPEQVERAMARLLQRVGTPTVSE